VRAGDSSSTLGRPVAEDLADGKTAL
jgi:hypothetical protein